MIEVDRLNRAADRIAAALLAVAIAYAAYTLLAGLDDAVRVGGSGALALGGFLAATASLGRLRDEPSFALAEFEPLPAEGLFEDCPETGAEAAEPADGDGEDALLLDDVLGAIDPEARVVQLFDPARMPTAGELQARIERHLHGAAAVPDATEDLYAALHSLRHSLR